MYILTKIRSELRWSGKKLANYLKMHHSTLYHYEKGIRKPTDERGHQMIKDLAKLGYNVVLSELRPTKDIMESFNDTITKEFRKRLKRDVSMNKET